MPRRRRPNIEPSDSEDRSRRMRNSLPIAYLAYCVFRDNNTANPAAAGTMFGLRVTFQRCSDGGRIPAPQHTVKVATAYESPEREEGYGIVTRKAFSTAAVELSCVFQKFLNS